MSASRGTVQFIPGPVPGTDRLAVYTLQPDGTLAWVEVPTGSVIIPPAPEPTPPPSPSPLVPGQVLDLTGWKLTIPVARPAGRPKSTQRYRTANVAAEVTQPGLATYADDWFYLNTAGTGVVFTAPVDGVTTAGSAYPRCELREMNPGGRTPASWSIAGPGPARLHVVESVNVLPPVKAQVVCAQIHNADDDVVEVLADGLTNPGRVVLTVRLRGKTTTKTVLDPDYQLGASFTLDITAAGGTVIVAYNGVDTIKWKAKDDGCYFKAGCYTQSNLSKDQAGAYGQVTLYTVTATHDG